MSAALDAAMAEIEATRIRLHREFKQRRKADRRETLMMIQSGRVSLMEWISGDYYLRHFAFDARDPARLCDVLMKEIRACQAARRRQHWSMGPGGSGAARFGSARNAIIIARYLRRFGCPAIAEAA